MNAQGLLDQLLRTAQSTLADTGLTQERGGRTGISDLGKGALAGGALGLLLGSRKVRKMGGKLVGYGGAAALGALAFKAFGDWQRSQARATPAAAEPRTLDRVPAVEAETHSRAVMVALIAGAKADGHVDDRERQLIDEELARLGATDPSLRQWLQAELDRPLDPAAVAAAATTPEVAAEMYLATLVAVDQQSWMERAYVDELARCLGLDAALRARLDAQVAELRAGG